MEEIGYTLDQKIEHSLEEKMGYNIVEEQTRESLCK